MPAYRDGAVRVRVPATSANLGPGFDCAGLALSLYDDVEVRLISGSTHVQVTGEGATTLPKADRHLVVRAARAAFERLGGQPPGGLRVSCHNRIAQSRGMGSSSAAICAGVLAARALVVDGEGLLSDDAVLALTTELEGHPDNVAACLRGGATFAWGDPVLVLRVEPHPDLRAVAFVPPHRSSTKTTRGLLPPMVPFADAAGNAGRAALLATALTQRMDLLLDATHDRLHQPYRAAAMIETAELVEQLRTAGIAAAVSGAGPTVLAVGDAVTAQAAADRCPEGWGVLSLTVDLEGACVDPVLY